MVIATYGTPAELYHHGVKGQKWGVRRYQNADGSLTAEGKKHQVIRNNIKRNLPHTDDVNDIVKSMSKSDKQKLGASLHEDWIEKDFEFETIANKANTFVKKVGDIPVSFFEIWTNESRTGQIAVGTRSGEEYRGKGYASEVVEKGMKWVDRYGKYTIDELEWWARKDNIGSNRLAEKYGFEKIEEKSKDYPEWNYYKKQLKRS